MKTFLVALAILNCITAETGKWGVEEQDDVAVLTNENFDEFVKNNKYAFVKFYAPWCGHCKTMAAGYSTLAKRMKGEEGAAIAKVDATVQKELGERFGVKGYPTLKFFIDGEPVDYSGARESDAIYNWIQKKTGSATKMLAELSEVKDVASKKLAVVLFTAAENTDTLKAFNALASSFDDVPFFYTHNAEVKAEYGVTAASGMMVFRDFDDGMKVLSNDSLTMEEMKTFVNANRFPLVMPFEQQAAERIFGSESPAIFVFTDETETATTQVFSAAAKANQNTGLTWSQSTITTGLGARLSEFLGVTAADANTVRIIKFVGGSLMKYKLTDVTVESITQFISDYKNDKLEAYFKSEAVPTENAGPVRIVVGNNFNEVVLGEEWVLLEAYAPWCGHCKKLDPIYNELAAKLAHNKDLIIAKMDATANEHPSLNVKGFPTIKFYKKGEKTAPVDYSGERTLEGFMAYLEKELGRNLTEGGAAVDTEL